MTGKYIWHLKHQHSFLNISRSSPGSQSNHQPIYLQWDSWLDCKLPHTSNATEQSNVFGFATTKYWNRASHLGVSLIAIIISFFLIWHNLPLQGRIQTSRSRIIWNTSARRLFKALAKNVYSLSNGQEMNSWSTLKRAAIKLQKNWSLQPQVPSIN